MRSVRKGMLALSAAVALSIPAFACNTTPQGAREDAAEEQREADQKAQEAREQERQEATDARQTAGERTGAAAETVDVKTALMADKSVDASGINVDTFAETRTVVLRGTVPTEVQKATAGRIAAREAEGYKVDNQLVVTPRR